MQRFFFDFSDAPPDEHGTDLLSLEAAEAEARAALLRTAADDGVLQAAVSVRDEAGQRLLAISLSLEVQGRETPG
jgi:hypothetical protein